MNNEAKSKLTEAGVKVGATVLGKLFDRCAKKRPHGLVAWWRRTFGRITPEQMADTAMDVVDEVKKAKKK